MTWELSSYEDNGIVRVLLNGVWPKGDIAEILVEIINNWSKGSHVNALLCDLRQMDHSPDVGTDAAMSQHFIAAGFNRVRKIAVLDRVCHKDVDETCQLILSNRGCNIKFFYEDSQEVYDWLLQ